jgi:hypothetical protein
VITLSFICEPPGAEDSTPPLILSLNNLYISEAHDIMLRERPRHATCNIQLSMHTEASSQPRRSTAPELLTTISSHLDVNVPPPRFRSIDEPSSFNVLRYLRGRTLGLRHLDIWEENKNTRDNETHIHCYETIGRIGGSLTCHAGPLLFAPTHVLSFFF